MAKKFMLEVLQQSLAFFENSTRCLDDSDSAFRPTPPMFSTAEQIAHTAQTVEWFATGAFSPQGFSLDFAAAHEQVRAVHTVSEARAWLHRAYQAAAAAISSHSEAELAAPLPPGPVLGGLRRSSIVGAIMDHTAHHRGALTVYTRLRGKVPPMPYGPG